MKTRKVWTKIWKDEWYCHLSKSAKLLFIYLITNDNIGFTGCYELTDRQITFDTGIDKELQKTKTELSPKVKFYDGWVYVINCQGYNGFLGSSFEIAIDKEKSLIPENIINALIYNKEPITPPMGLGLGGDTNSNNNINNNYINTNKDYMESITSEIILEIANKYSISENTVKDKLEAIRLWEEEKPGRMKGRNWKATLMNWIRRDIENGKIKKISTKTETNIIEQSPEEKAKALQKLEEVKNNNPLFIEKFYASNKPAVDQKR